MKNHRLAACLFAFFWLQKAALGQFQIGHATITFTDPTRSNRQIPTEIYYPADAAGDNVPCAAGAFPVVHFGHGFVMVWSAYQNIWQALVPEGFIVCFPKTEGSFSPNHTAFANDLGFLCSAMLAENALASSIFYGHVEPSFGVAGHSMGGGCAVLANGYGGGQIRAIATLAAANTSPSAIAAASGVAIPTLTIAGSYDCIAPPAQHQLPIFQAFQPDLCKIYVNLTGASHCQFGNSNTNCTLGQAASGCNAPPMTQATQQSQTAALLKPFFKRYLKDDDDAWLDLTAALSGGPFSKMHMCAELSAADEKAEAEPFSVFLAENPPKNGLLQLVFDGVGEGEKASFELFDLLGRRLFSVFEKPIFENETVEIALPPTARGPLFLVAKSQNGNRASRLFWAE